MSMTAIGVGASTGISHTLNGITYRTFTAPLPKVRAATVNALERMGIKVASSERLQGGGGELIKANTADRAIEIELESISPNTTRMRTVARKNALLLDSATATEIILQTEKGLKPV